MTKAYDFPVSFTCRHEECDDQFRDAAIEQVRKLSRFHSRIVGGSIIVDRKNPSVRVEVSVRVPGTVITAVHDDFNRTIALDAAIEKARAQIKKLKEKILDRRTPADDLYLAGPESEQV
jgi:ribosomal subunit interface protein